MTVTSTELSNEQKKYLRRIGHDLKPTVTIADKGLSKTVLAELERALSDHELIKVKLAVSDRDKRQQLLAQITKTCKTELVQTIGHMALLLRKSSEPNPKLSNLLRSPGKNKN